MLRLYITRHGQTEWNIAGKMQGWADSPLTKQGIDDAKILSNHLKDIKFNAIYSSPSSRAYDTAEIVKGNRPIEIIKDERIKEINVGIWEGQTQDFLKETYPNEFVAFWETPHLFQPIDGESFQDVQGRIELFIEDLQSRHLSGNILIVTHSCTLKLTLAYIKRLTLDKLWDPPRIGNTSLSIAELAGDGAMALTLEGDTSHLVVTK